MKIRVLIADRKTSIRFGLEVLLGEQPELELVGVVEDGDGLLLEIENKYPDLVIIGWGLPGLSMNDLLTEMRHRSKKIRVIVLSEKAKFRSTAMGAGANAFMHEGDPPQKLLAILQEFQTEISYPSDIEIQ